MGMEDFIIYKGKKIKSGDRIKCNISEYEVENARLYVLSDLERSQNLDLYSNTIGFICQNVRSGRKSPNMLGYNWSWAFGNVMCNMHIINPVEFTSDTQISDAVRGIEKVTMDFCDGILNLAFPNKG